MRHASAGISAVEQQDVEGDEYDGDVLQLDGSDEDEPHLEVGSQRGQSDENGHDGRRSPVDDALGVGECGEEIVRHEVQGESRQTAEEIHGDEALGVVQVGEVPPGEIQQQHVEQDVEQTLVNEHVGEDGPRAAQHVIGIAAARDPLQHFSLHALHVEQESTHGDDVDQHENRYIDVDEAQRDVRFRKLVFQLPHQSGHVKILCTCWWVG